MTTILEMKKPKAYKIFKNLADSDFIFYYDENWLRIVTLLRIKSEDYEITMKWDTQLIIQNIDKELPNLS